GAGGGGWGGGGGVRTCDGCRAGRRPGRSYATSPQLWDVWRGRIFGSPTAVGSKRGRWMLDTIWLEARRRIRDRIAEKDFDTWIEPLHASGWSNGQLTIEAPSVFYRDWLR